MTEIVKQGLELMEEKKAEELAIKFISAKYGKTLSQEEQIMFIEICKAARLNPFTREIHAVAYGKGEYRTFNIITGYEVYLKRGMATGLVKHWDVQIEKTEDRKDAIATITIDRADWEKPFVHTVYYKECVQTKKIKGSDGRYIEQPNSIWNSKPMTMLKKVAISQGFRLCFPEYLSILPYSEEEFVSDDSFNDIDAIDITEPKSKTEAKNENNAK